MVRKVGLTLLLLCTLMTAISAKAAEMEVRRGMLCDTPKQVEDFVAYVNEGIEVMLAEYAVNEAAGERVCNNVTTLSARGEDLLLITLVKWRVTITRVEVYGLYDNEGNPIMISNFPILTQYAIFAYDGL